MFWLHIKYVRRMHFLLVWSVFNRVRSAFKLHFTCSIDFDEAFMRPCCYKPTDCSCDVKRGGVTPQKPPCEQAVSFCKHQRPRPA